MRRSEAKAVPQARVKDSSADLYERKWAQLKNLCVGPQLQEWNVILDPDGMGQQNSNVVSKFVTFFYHKVVEKSFDLGEAVHIRSTHASTYKREFERIVNREVYDNRNTEFIPVNRLLICETMKAYQRNNNSVRNKIALPFW